MREITSGAVPIASASCRCVIPACFRSVASRLPTLTSIVMLPAYHVDGLRCDDAQQHRF